MSALDAAGLDHAVFLDELVRLRTWGTGEERIGDYLQGSPCGLQDIPQPMIEPVIFKNAAERGARSVDLTSRPSREAANRLYRRLGFEPRETNVYRYQG